MKNEIPVSYTHLQTAKLFTKRLKGALSRCRGISENILSSSDSAKAELRRINPPPNSFEICGCGIMTSRREPNLCEASLRTPERTIY